jgi:hypothetical protein
MKKQLLTGMALFTAISAFPQNARKPQSNGTVNMQEIISGKTALRQEPLVTQKSQPNPASPIQPDRQNGGLNKNSGTSAITWSPIGGSQNIYGVLYSESEPLQYNPNVNAVSFVHRANEGYVGKPSTAGTESGAMVAEISTNFGTTWDSTCFFSHVSLQARYPQGAIYSAPGNTNIASAYIVGSGPVTDGTNWVSSWFASKQLGANYNYTASSAPNAMQILSNSSTFKFDYPTYSFSSTDDGMIRSLGIVSKDINGTTNLSFGFKGAMVVKGTFNAGVFNWTGDSLFPNTVTRTDGTKQIWGSPIMAWNQAGTTGYVVFIGAQATATASNKGWQPIIYKTTDSGVNWALANGIDFNSTSMAGVKRSLAGIKTNTAIEVPFFQVGEGYDALVDANNKLHILTTVVGTSSSHQDSLEYTYQFRTENYSWPHTPGFRPYVYDFIGDGSAAWSYVLVDSLGSEGPGANSGDPGYTSNPWDADANYKPSSGARLQMSRTADGKYITYTWAESDSAFTQDSKIWSSQPNLVARLLMVGTTSNTLSPSEIQLTKTVVGPVAGRAMFHYTSPVSKFVSSTGSAPSCSVQVKVPLTVSNSNPYKQLEKNVHHYTTATLDFACSLVGLKEHAPGIFNGLDVYPNPAENEVTISVDLKETENLSAYIYSAVGQQVSSENIKGFAGSNKIKMNIQNLATGIYFVKVKAGNSESTRKLIVE